MRRTHISLTEAKQHLGELVKRAAYGGETIVLEFRGKAQAAIVSIEDLETIDRRTRDRDQALAALGRMNAVRERQAPYNKAEFDVVTEVRKLRQWPDG
jgi:prevent-host-death family protein